MFVDIAFDVGADHRLGLLLMKKHISGPGLARYAMGRCVYCRAMGQPTQLFNTSDPVLGRDCLYMSKDSNH